MITPNDLKAGDSWCQYCGATQRAVNAYEPMLAALEGLLGILATAESNASGNPEWEYVSGKINAARDAIAQAKVMS